MRFALPVILLALPLCAQDAELSQLIKTLAPKLAERPAGPVAVFKFGGGRGTTANIGSYLADRVGAQLLSASKRQVITREQTDELGPATQSRMADLVQQFHAAVAVTGNYTVMEKEISVTVFFRDPVTFIAFAGDSVALPRTASMNSMLGDTEEPSSPALTSRRRNEPAAPAVFRPEPETRVFRPDPSRIDPPKTPLSIAPGTMVAVRLIEPIYSDYARPGQTFRASLDRDLEQGGRVIATSHADVLVEVVSWNGRTLALGLRSVRSKDGDYISVTSAPVYHEAKATKGGRAKSGLKWGAIGAAIGAVAGGGAGAAVGAGAGAGAGSTIDPGQKGVSLASESRLEFRVE